MTIPLDRLYHFIETVAADIYKDNVVIYRFWPHGSKNIEDLNQLHSELSWQNCVSSPLIWCHDQEPLNYQYYAINLKQLNGHSWLDILDTIGMSWPLTNLNWNKNWFKKNLLLHSEQRSEEVSKYESADELIPVYYWNHALLSMDWFRFAQHENFNKNVKKQFLIYNRAWGGTREYRLKFLELLVNNNLVDCSRSYFNPIDPESQIHYIQHQFQNQSWLPKLDLTRYFEPSSALASSSADFYTKDYQETEIEVVLETLFDDTRLHLTEKTLRPIACKQPFILVGTHGSLEYLRNYGFETFSSIWNEDYDLESDPVKRMTKIISVMKEISCWDNSTRAKKLVQASEIARRNQQHFYSKNFFQQVIDELKLNLQKAFYQMKIDHDLESWLHRWENLLEFEEVIYFLKNNTNATAPNMKHLQKLMNRARLR